MLWLIGLIDFPSHFIWANGDVLWQHGSEQKLHYEGLCWISEGKFWWTEHETQHKYNRLTVSQVNSRASLASKWRSEHVGYIKRARSNAQSWLPVKGTSVLQILFSQTSQHTTMPRCLFIYLLAIDNVCNCSFCIFCLYILQKTQISHASLHKLNNQTYFNTKSLSQEANLIRPHPKYKPARTGRALERRSSWGINSSEDGIMGSVCPCPLPPTTQQQKRKKACMAHSTSQLTLIPVMSLCQVGCIDLFQPQICP